MLVVSTISPPLLSLPGGLITAFQVMGIATSYVTQTNPDSRTPYSKFFQSSKTKKEISSRLGMFVLYALPLLAAASSQVWLSQNPAGMLVVAHFLKRVLEVVFVHSYSGSMGFETAIVIGVVYSLWSLLIGSLANVAPTQESLSLGVALFGLGSFGNLYHHVLLSRLRGPDQKGYVAPKGGLFEYVAAPHYMFELVAWLGIAVASQHGNAYLVWLLMVSYLSGRSVAQNEWNREKFEEDLWPRGRKNMIPFIF